MSLDLEQQLRASYADRLGAVDVPAGDPAAARRTGLRMRRSRRFAVAGVTAAVVAVAVAGVVDGRDGRSVEPTAPLGHWREIPAPPLSPRAEAQAVWTGSEVLVIGGGTEVCPPTADCIADVIHALRDGAAYDPRTNSWRTIPPAPVPVVPGDRLVVANGIVVLEHTRRLATRWFTYEPDRNRWSRIAHAPANATNDATAVGSHVYVSTGRRVAVYDVDRSRWSLLPPDRNNPRLTQRSVTATSAGAVVTGFDATQPNDGIEPSLVLADVWDGTAWRRLPPSDQLEGAFVWTGRRLVDATPFTENGGEVNGWGRDIPQGGTLDPSTGEWGRLPKALTGDPGGWSVSASGGAWFASAGQAYDDDSGRVYDLDRPDGAADYAVAGAWADGRLLVFGGVDTSQGYTGKALTNRAWIWTP